jgi:hypothetical protein
MGEKGGPANLSLVTSLPTAIFPLLSCFSLCVGTQSKAKDTEKIQTTKDGKKVDKRKRRLTIGSCALLGLGAVRRKSPSLFLSPFSCV